MDMIEAREGMGRLISRAARQWRRAVDLRLRGFGLTEAAWLPLLHLARANAPMRQKELAASLALDGSTVARLLDGLQAAGLIERKEDADDRRAKTIVLTRAGLVQVAQVETVAGEVRGQALEALSDAEIAAATRVLQHVSLTLSALPDVEAPPA